MKCRFIKLMSSLNASLIYFYKIYFARPRGIPVYLFIAFCGPLLAPKRYQQKLDFYGSIEILFIVYFATLKQNSPFTMIK